MYRIALWISSLAFLAVAAQADASDRWLKKRNAEELYVYVNVVDCPITNEDITGDIQKLLIRSRIKPMTTWNPGEVSLYVAVDCVAVSDGGWMFQALILLAQLEKERGDDVVISFREQDYFGSFGKGTEATIRKVALEGAEKAFMKYLNANFDLDPG